LFHVGRLAPGCSGIAGDFYGPQNRRGWRDEAQADSDAQNSIYRLRDAFPRFLRIFATPGQAHVDVAWSQEGTTPNSTKRRFANFLNGAGKNPYAACRGLNREQSSPRGKQKRGGPAKREKKRVSALGGTFHLSRGGAADTFRFRKLQALGRSAIQPKPRPIDRRHPGSKAAGPAGGKRR